MSASSIYHTFGPLGSYYYFLLLKIDLIGIGIMIFGLTLSAVYIGFHNWEWERDTIILGMGSLMVCNLAIGMTPCYAEERFDKHRIVFYVFTLVLCFGLALSARFIYSTSIEVEKFYGQLWLSFALLGIGFVFY